MVDVLLILRPDAHAVHHGQLDVDFVRRLEAVRHFDLLEALNRVGVDALLATIQNGQRLAAHVRAVAHVHGFIGDVADGVAGEIRHDLPLDGVVRYIGAAGGVFARLRALPRVVKAGRHSVAGDEAGLAVAGQRVGIIQLVAVVIRLIERQVEAAVVQARHQLVAGGLRRFGRALRGRGHGLRVVVGGGYVLQLFQPSDALLVIVVVHGLAENAKVRGQRRAADDQRHHDGEDQRGRNLSFHNRFFPSDGPQHRLTAFGRKLALGKACLQRVSQLLFIHQIHTPPKVFFSIC